MRIIVLSDVHCNMLRCQDVALRNPDALVLQLGDLGVGWLHRETIENLPPNFHFFVGNHDNRTMARTFRNCIGEFGDWNGIFYVSGGDSIDRDRRIEGVNWWPDEELTYGQGQECIDQWVRSEAEILVTHDCPQFIAENYHLIYDRCMTRNILEQMHKARKPKLHIYGHHHRAKDLTHNGTRFVCLKMDDTFPLDIS